MNKNRIILCAVGGGFGLAVLVMLYLVFSSVSARTAAIEGDAEADVTGLEEVESKAQTLMRSKVFPCAASVKAIEKNAEAMADWQKEAIRLASRGDRVYAATTPATFKTFIVSDAKRLSALPGMVGGMLVKPDFAFGPFKAYIAEGKMPSEAQLGELQRQWDDVATVTEMLAVSGIAELLDVQFGKSEVDAEAEAAAQQPKKGKGKKAKKSAKKSAEAERVEPAAQSYVFAFATRPSGLVKVINALATCERFVTVDDFTFVREQDQIAAALGGGEKKSAQGGGARSRRGRRAAARVEAAPVEDEAKPKNGAITDPVKDPPLKVTLKVTVRDFRTLEETGKKEEEQK